MKLLFRVTALIIAILLLAFGLIFYITWTSNVKTLEAQAEARLEELAFNVMDKIDRTLFERIGDLEAISTDPVMTSRDSSPRQMTERLIGYRNIYKTYVSLSFFDLDRRRIADTARLDLGKQVEKQQYWDDVMQGKLSLASTIGIAGSLNSPVIFFASPVKDKDKQLMGVVVTRMPVDKLYEIIGQISTMTKMNEAFHIDLVNRDGLLIYSNYNRKGMFREKLSYWETIKNLKGNIGFLKAHQHPGQEESVAIFCREQGYLDFKGNGWTLAIHVPTRIVFAPVVELRKKWLIVIMPSIVLSIILVLWFAFRFSQPLTALRDAVIEFGKGNLDTKVKIESRDEIGELGKVFNQMGENLKATTTSIDNLEREITERKSEENRIRKLNQLQALLLDPDILEKQLKKITDGVVAIFSADFCRIWLIDQGDRCDTGCAHAAVTEGPHVCRYRDKCLHLAASSGRYTHLDGETHRRVPFGCYKIGSIASGEDSSFLTNDVTNDPRVHNHEWAKQLGLVSFAGFQLRPPHGETKGVLALFSQSVISDEEYSLLEGVSNLTMRIIQTAQAQEAVQESEGKYRSLIETTNTGYVIIDLAGTVLDANDEYARLTGHESRDEILGRSVVEWTAAYDKERNAKAVEECVRQGFVRNFEVDYAVTQGQTIPVETNATLVTTRSGPQILALCRDITERKRAEGEIKKYYTLFKTSTDAIMMLTQDGRFFDGNKAAFDLFGFSSKENFIQMHPSELSPPTQPDGKDSLTASLQHIENALAKGSDFFDWVHKKEDGTLFSAGVRLSSLELGGEVVLQALVRDITERRQAEEALRESERKYRFLYQEFHGLLNGIPDTLALLSPDLKIVWANEIAASAFGLNAAELIGQYCYQFRHHRSEPCELCPIQKSFQSGKSEFQEQVTPDGRIWDLRAIPVFEDNGKVKVVIEVARDITERKRAEEEREKLIIELRTSLEKVKTLSGMLPICASCKKIRDDKGYWNQIESYIRDHSEAEFSHGICPECMKKLYPDFEIVE